MSDQKRGSKKRKKVYKEKSRIRRAFGHFIWNVAFAVSLLVFIISAGSLLQIYLEYKTGTDEYAALEKQIVTELPVSGTRPDSQGIQDTETNLPEDSGADSVISESPGAEAVAEQVPVPLQIDFQALAQINPDVIGWIYIEALGISYPIVQGGDNDWYLHRTYEGTENSAGSIFMDWQNSSDFSDSNTIIYGHNMKNQSMFGKLKFLDTQEKYKDSVWFWILTPEVSMRYRIVSAYYVEETSPVYTLFSEGSPEFAAYAVNCLGLNQLPIEQPEADQIRSLVTLSTCAARNSSQRFVVQGMCVQKTETGI